MGRVLGETMGAVARIGFESFAKTYALVSLTGGNHDRDRRLCTEAFAWVNYPDLACLGRKLSRQLDTALLLE